MISEVYFAYTSPFVEPSHSFFTSAKKRKIGGVITPLLLCLFLSSLFLPPRQFWHHLISHFLCFLSRFTHKLHRCVYTSFLHLLFTCQFATLLVLAMDTISVVKFRCRLFIQRHPATFTLVHVLLFGYLYPVAFICIFNVQFQAQFLRSWFEIALNASSLKFFFTYGQPSFFYSARISRASSPISLLPVKLVFPFFFHLISYLFIAIDK